MGPVPTDPSPGSGWHDRQRQYLEGWLHNKVHAGLLEDLHPGGIAYWHNLCLVDRQLWLKHKAIRGAAGTSQGKVTVSHPIFRWVNIWRFGTLNHLQIDLQKNSNFLLLLLCIFGEHPLCYLIWSWFSTMYKSGLLSIRLREKKRYLAGAKLGSALVWLRLS